MSITVVTDVFCDRCGIWENGATSYKVQSAKARRKLRKRGWVCRRGTDGKLIDLCPKCANTSEEVA